MKLGIISDAHGNPFGLKSCLDHLRNVEKVERIYFLGDAVGYCSDYTTTLGLLQAEDVTSLMGNHEAMLLGKLALDEDKDQVYRLRRHAPQMTATSLAFLGQLSPQLELEWAGRKLLLVHASPWDPLTEYIYPNSDLSRFRSLEYDAVFMGHTHYPMTRAVGDVLVANPGSCGLPRSHGAFATCAVYDAGQHTVEIIRIPMRVNDICHYFGDSIHDAVKQCLHRH